MVGLLIALAVLCILFATGTINLKSNGNDININSNEEKNNNSNSENVNENQTIVSNSSTIDFNNIETDLENIENATTTNIYIKDDIDELGYEARHFSATLYLNGDVTFSTIFRDSDKHSTNNLEIHNVKEMLQFSIASATREQMIYFLTENGDVYSYVVGESINNNFTPKKVENISNVTKLFSYSYPAKKNTGGSWAICALINNKTVKVLKTESV